MKNIKQFLNEQLELNKDSEPANDKYLDAHEINGPKTKGVTYDGEQVTIFGRPFINEYDPKFKDAQKLAMDNGAKIVNEWSDIENKEMFHHFVIAGNSKKAAIFAYDSSGVLGLK